MADGVRIRIVGDDSEFVKTLQGLEKQARTAFQGIRTAGGDWGLGSVSTLLGLCMGRVGQLGAQLERLRPSVQKSLEGLASGLAGRLTYGVDIEGDMSSLEGAMADAADGLAGGIRARQGAVVSAANRLAAAARAAMSDTNGAYNAGAQMAAGFQRGLNAKNSAVEAAARDLAGAATDALRSTLQIRSPSRVTMKMGEFAGQGFEIGLTDSLQAAVRSAGRIAGEMNLSPKTGMAAGMQGADMQHRAAQPIYLNVDGRTLASVITDDMRTAMNRRSRSIGLGVGR